MTILHILSLAGYFIILFEYIAMRHRVICAESDAKIGIELYDRISAARPHPTQDWAEALASQWLYWNRGTK